MIPEKAAELLRTPHGNLITSMLDKIPTRRILCSAKHLLHTVVNLCKLKPKAHDKEIKTSLSLSYSGSAFSNNPL
jgi:hypothetical protein